MITGRPQVWPCLKTSPMVGEMPTDRGDRHSERPSDGRNGLAVGDRRPRGCEPFRRHHGRASADPFV